MKRELQNFNDFLQEARDPAYYQDTFYLTVLISMDKNRGGSRDETKNDIRALPEVLTVTLVEKEKGGVQRDMGNSYMSTLKLHIRRPRDTSKEMMMKRLVKQIARLKGISVLRYKERKPKVRKKAFHGPGSYTKRVQNVQERRKRKTRKPKIKPGYQQSGARRARLRKGFNRLTQTGPNNSGPFRKVTQQPSWKSAPPGAPGGLEEGALIEAMKTAADLPENIIVVVLKEPDSSGFLVYYAHRDNPKNRLKPGDLDRIEAGIDIYGVLRVAEGRNEPYNGVYIVTSAKAKDGYGPLLYDVALEVANSQGLKPDTLDVSDDASAVWKYYDTSRSDVESKMLVSDIDEFDTVMPPERAEDPGANEHLAQVYFKTKKNTIQELIDENKFLELHPGVALPEPSPRDELQDLARELDVPIVKSTDLSRFDHLREELRIMIGSGDDELATFAMQDTLQQKVWDGEERVRPGVKGALMEIVDEFVENLDLDAEIKDIIITGSLANYNWSKFSDIDLHILIDFKEVNENEDLVRRFFNAVRSNWNKLHDINVKGHEVELYVQDEHEPHVSTGVYSLQDDRWIVKPNKVKPHIDKASAKKKAAHLEREVDKVAAILYDGDYERALEDAARLKEKIKTMRKTGLDRAGIFSPENLAFKMLRRSGAIEKLFTTFTEAYDLALSLDQ